LADMHYLAVQKEPSRRREQICWSEKWTEEKENRQLIIRGRGWGGKWVLMKGQGRPSWLVSDDRITKREGGKEKGLSHQGGSWIGKAWGEFCAKSLSMT